MDFRKDKYIMPFFKKKQGGNSELVNLYQHLPNKFLHIKKFKFLGYESLLRSKEYKKSTI
jgi:hypothetical protein